MKKVNLLIAALLTFALVIYHPITTLDPRTGDGYPPPTEARI